MEFRMKNNFFLLRMTWNFTVPSKSQETHKISDILNKSIFYTTK